MIRRISSLALGIALSFTAFSAFAQDEGGGEGGGEPAAGGEEAAPAEGGGEEAKPAEGGEAKASGEAAASTEGVPDTGGKIKVGLRLGYGLPMGESAKGAKMSDGISGMIPIWLDLGYMVTPNIMVGLYAQYGLLMIKDCPSGVDCSGSDMRFGLQGQYHLSPAESMDPWFGLGVGYEMMSTKLSAGGADTTATLSGLEFANIQAGADFKVGPLGVGPFVSFSLGQYSKAKVETPAGSADGDITDKAMHQWLVIGVKGTMGF
jgi:hypothetical protein